MYEKYCFRYITSLKHVRIRIWIKQSDPYSFQSEKQDPDTDRYQSKMFDLNPDPYQKGLD